MDLGIALEGFFFEKVNGSTGQRVTFAFHYIIYVVSSGAVRSAASSYTAMRMVAG